MSSSVVEVQEARARSAHVSEEALEVELLDGRTIIVPLVWFPRLWHATPEEHNHFEIFGDGAYLHWPDLDEDLTVAGLLAGRPSAESAQSLKKWLLSRKAKHRSRGSTEPSRGGKQPTHKRAPGVPS
ncbi:MAG: DUF2442 domain-containing protein [Acidobacteria bacterium]|nr:DUF2442 domain-containing protein [Acidobacteriota bacterium]